MKSAATMGRARLFEHLRYDPMGDGATPESDTSKRLPPLTTEQADLFKSLASQSLKRRR
jgi:hypothetical protein